jgi:hypothetical protein
MVSFRYTYVQQISDCDSIKLELPCHGKPNSTCSDACASSDLLPLDVVWFQWVRSVWDLTRDFWAEFEGIILWAGFLQRVDVSHGVIGKYKRYEKCGGLSTASRDETARLRSR